MISISRKEQLAVVYHIADYDDGSLHSGSQTRWFGSTLDLIVTVEGTINPQTGYLLDLKELKKIIRKHVIDRFDRRLLNDDQAFRQGPISMELLAMEIYRCLSFKFLNSGVSVKTVKLKQGADLSITVCCGDR